ncbi:hypothetical protein [Moritella sp. F3]|uniref:hypothetical protein n=1 Tax=Moritella sp. F3 TaxID=2718882 RepID=UPI0018E11F54|nr:hypothetical protein [Moritella sp. F3]GIC77190.1 hypothetical protein FMO001_19170 [Moritella sp. F1]GIC82309.1 hypothetical protein FMO003_25900 [Moritella sp. F3]
MAAKAEDKVELRKAQLRKAQKNFKLNQKVGGRKPQSFLFSKEDHDNMVFIKSEVKDVGSKEKAISYALSEMAKQLRSKKGLDKV